MIKKTYIILFLLLTFCNKKENSTDKYEKNIKEKVIYSSSGSMNSSLIQEKQLSGVLIRVEWKNLETSPGVFNWALIDNQLSLIKSVNKKYSLSIIAGSFSPSWLYSNPYNTEYMNLTFRGSPVKVPLIQDLSLKNRLFFLFQKLSERYSNDSSLYLIYLPQMTLNGVEGHFNGISNDTLTSQSFNEDLWIEYSCSYLEELFKYFPDKKIAIELHYILGSNYAPSKIIEYIESKEKFKNNVGVAIWWLSGKYSYQSELISSISNFSKNDGLVFAQLIDKSINSNSFYNNDFSSSFTQAINLGINYIEIWEEDFLESNEQILSNYLDN